MIKSLKTLVRNIGLFGKELFKAEYEEIAKADYRYFVCASRNGLCVKNLLSRFLKEVGDGRYVLRLSNLSFCSRRSLAKKLMKSGSYIPSEVEFKLWILKSNQGGLEIIGCRSCEESEDLVAALARSARRKLVHVSRNVRTEIDVYNIFDNRGRNEDSNVGMVQSKIESKAA
jgi:hypothetical protein